MLEHQTQWMCTGTEVMNIPSTTGQKVLAAVGRSSVSISVFVSHRMSARRHVHIPVSPEPRICRLLLANRRRSDRNMVAETPDGRHRSGAVILRCTEVRSLYEHPVGTSKRHRCAKHAVDARSAGSWWHCGVPGKYWGIDALRLLNIEPWIFANHGYLGSL